MRGLRVHQVDLAQPFLAALRPFALFGEEPEELHGKVMHRLPCTQQDERRDYQQEDDDTGEHVFDGLRQNLTQPAEAGDEHDEGIDEYRRFMVDKFQDEQPDAASGIEPASVKVDALHRYRDRAAACGQAEGTEEGQLEGLTVAQLRQTAAQKRHAHRGVDKLVAQPHREQQTHTGNRDLRQGGDDLRELIAEHDIQKQENERQRGKPADKGTFFGSIHFEQLSFTGSAA